ncbi:MAG: L,D-transpeptidase [Nitrospinae bacterium]|nr:L,D-transpeptidase [Nitrospinota bacterium]MDA1109873.1 L,D-transpeptidase [Nitrospinota bacterium]
MTQARIIQLVEKDLDKVNPLESTSSASSSFSSASTDRKLAVLNVPDYNLIANKDPRGSYDRKTRENLYWIIEKLQGNPVRLTSLERRLLEKFGNASFSPLKAQDKKVKFEVAWYRLSLGVKRYLKLTAMAFLILGTATWMIYQFGVDSETQREIDMAYYAGMNRVGLVSKEDFEHINENLTATSLKLAETRKNNVELSRMVEQMILNNQVTENFKYILKQIYQDPRTKYVKKGDQVSLVFNDRNIASYKSRPELWYIVGVIESGVIRVYYDNEKILETEAIFGRTGEETPAGEYEIVNKVFKPTWYKKETLNGKTRVRAIPFGHEEHDIGRWWMGLKKVGEPVKGSYGIHGVNIQKVNEFYKKNFDWRNGSAGCPNIQGWYLQFLAKVVPVGAHVNIVQKDKWQSEQQVSPPSAA